MQSSNTDVTISGNKITMTVFSISTKKTYLKIELFQLDLWNWPASQKASVSEYCID